MRTWLFGTGDHLQDAKLWPSTWSHCHGARRPFPWQFCCCSVMLKVEQRIDSGQLKLHDEVGWLPV